MAAPARIAELIPGGSEWEDRSWFPPGPQLAICLSGDTGHLSALSEAELLEVAAAARRQTSWAQARELAAIAELTHRRTHSDNNSDGDGDGEPDGDGDGAEDDQQDVRVVSAYESVIEEVAAALTLTGNAAATLVHLADRLTHHLPGTRHHLETGQLDLPKVRVICDLTDHLDQGLPERIEARVLPTAPGQTTGQLRRRVKTLVERLAPAQRQERARDAVVRRRLELWETPTGTADLALLDLDPAHAHAVYNKITAVAHALKTDGDTRRIDQIRADLATTLLHGTDLPTATRIHATEVTSTAGRDQRAAAPSTPDNCTDQTGQAPSTSDDSADTDVHAAELGRSIGQRLTQVLNHARATRRTADLHSMINRAVDQIRGRLVQDHPCRAAIIKGVHGKPGYRPPAALRQLIEERHTTCVFPSCNQPSTRCDLDHTTPWQPGPTCHCNLAPLCRRHHRVKQTPGWRLVQPWPGLLIWITPAGNWHIRLPDRR